MVPFSVPTCDYLTVTIPLDVSDLVARQVRDILSYLPGLTCTQDKRWHVVGYSRSMFLFMRRGKVAIFSASGSALQALRDHDLFQEYLMVMATEGAHRVTRLDAALDFATEASPTVMSLYRKGLRNTKAFHLGQKAAPVRGTYSRSEITGFETGTTYIGSKQAEIKARVYDKREEQVATREPDPGPMLRYELTVTSKVLPSLKDAFDPTALFWHFISPDVLKKPKGIPVWVPGGEGFSIGDTPSLHPLKAFARRLEYSTEFSDLCTSARLIPKGVLVLCQALVKQGIEVIPPVNTYDEKWRLQTELGVDVGKRGLLPQMGVTQSDVYQPPSPGNELPQSTERKKKPNRWVY